MAHQSKEPTTHLLRKTTKILQNVADESERSLDCVVLCGDGRCQHRPLRPADSPVEKEDQEERDYHDLRNQPFDYEMWQEAARTASSPNAMGKKGCGISNAPLPDEKTEEGSPEGWFQGEEEHQCAARGAEEPPTKKVRLNGLEGEAAGRRRCACPRWKAAPGSE